MSTEETFGQWLKQRRKALDLTQQELAQRVGCATITVQKIEANERRPSKQVAALLAEHLGIADVLHNLAHLAQAQGHYPLAARLYQESLALYSKQGNEQGVARCCAGLAAVEGQVDGDG